MSLGMSQSRPQQPSLLWPLCSYLLVNAAPAARRRAELVRGYYGAPKSTAGAPGKPRPAIAGANDSVTALGRGFLEKPSQSRAGSDASEPARTSGKRGLREE